MAREQLKTLTEPMYYLLLTLIQPQHGYGIMQSIGELTKDRVQVGAGTLYALLARFEGEGFISQIREQDRKKIYQITPQGAEILREEYCRLNQMVEDAKEFFDSKGGLLPIDYALVEQEALAEQAREAEEKEGAAQRQEEGEGKAAGAGEGEEKPAIETPEKESKSKEPKSSESKGTEPKGTEPRKGIGRGFRKGIFAT